MEHHIEIINIFENFNPQNYFTTFCDITTCNMQYTHYIKLIDTRSNTYFNIVDAFFFYQTLQMQTLEF